MNDTSDSDDSAFLITTRFSKRKIRSNADETKKTKLTNNLRKNEIINLDEGTIHGKGGDFIIQTSSVACNDNFNQTEFEKESFEKCMVADKSPTLKNENNIKQKSKLLHSRISDYYSCPLCLKSFDSEITHISHMKQCAKKSQMTPKQLLQALEMHKDELKRRVQSGLSSFSPLRKKKTGNQNDPESSYELALGLALSKSLSEVNSNHFENHNLNFKNNIMKNNKTTLERFGFTNSNSNLGGTGRRKLKNWKTIRYTLRERTKEQREGLITEKAAVILLCKDYEVEFYKKPEQARLYDLKYGYIRESEKEGSLWKLGENEDNTNWYVENIKCFMLDGLRECVDGGNTRNSEECEIAELIKRLNLPQISFFQDWRKLVNNRHLSDINFLSESSETFYLHSVVLYVRCPKMLELDLQNVFGKFNTVTIHIFLQYLYCGVLDGLKRSELENLFELAQLINFEELSQVLSVLKKNLNGSERDEITLQSTKALCQKEENVRSSLNEKIEFLNALHQKELLKLNSQISSSNSNGSRQERIRQTCNIEDAENETGQDFIKSSKDKEEAFWEPKKTENTVNHMETEEQIYGTLNGKADENKLSYTDKILISNEESSDKDIEIEDLEKDMFEEADVLSHTNNIPDSLNYIPPHCEDKTNECILVSNGSSKHGWSNEERREELNEQNEEIPLTDCEIPYFDPYEHFNSEIPIPDSPVLNEDDILRSQSLFLDKISCVKLSSPCPENSPHNEGISFPDLEPVTPIAMRSASQTSDFCSTPIIRLDTPKSTSNRNKYGRKNSKRGETRKSQSLCFKRNRSAIASRLKKSTLLKFGSAKKKRKTSRGVKSDEEDSEKETDISTRSTLKDFDNSFERTTENSPESRTRKFIEVTPIAVGEEFSEEVTPLPDYSIMGASGIKKHLTKYGLKKSLSKNKAKRILRHIYEELHPVINTRNGKIIKYELMEKKKQTRKKCEGKKRKSLKRKKMERAEEKALNENGVRETSFRNLGEDSSGNCSTLARSEEEGIASLSGDTNTLERSDELVFERSDSEIQGSQSQTNFSSGNDVREAVFDFVHSNPEIHRRILMYEPIWLENFRKQLYEKYNKKFKLTDIMDCLDAECITFRCESQSRTNRTKARNTKSKNLKNK